MRAVRLQPHVDNMTKIKRAGDARQLGRLLAAALATLAGGEDRRAAGGGSLYWGSKVMGFTGTFRGPLLGPPHYKLEYSYLALVMQAFC